MIMEIFDVKEEVFYGYIWPLLEWNDLLRFRQVSKYGKRLISSYLWSQIDRVPELEINETKNTLEQFLEMDIPTTKIYLNNQMSGPKYFESKATTINNLLTTYGPMLKELRIHTLSQFLIGKEREFFNQLSQFTSKLDTLVVRNWVGFADEHVEETSAQLLTWDKSERIISYDNMFPAVFKTLKRVEMGMEDNWKSEGSSVFIASKALLIACVQAEVVAVPFNYDEGCTFPNVPAMRDFPRPYPGFSMIAFIEFLTGKIWTESTENGATALKSYNFKYTYYYNTEVVKRLNVYEHDFNCSGSFLNLCKACVENRITLELVNCKWFTVYAFFAVDDNDTAVRNITSCVKSLMNLNPVVITGFNFHNVEKLHVATSQSCLPAISSVWPSLTELCLVIDSEMMDKGRCNISGWIVEYQPVPSIQVFNRCFDNMDCPRLTDLSITFEIHGDGTTLPEVTLTMTRNIVRSCSNLTKLALKNWTGTKKSLMLLWEGLPNLEEITLEDCSSLGIVEFVGLDAENPVFCRLRRLRKLSLLGVDKMPKITNTLFTLVLCHMSLTHLKLTSQQPIKNVDADGIRSLIKGMFIRSVEKFSFEGWSLADCSMEEFHHLGLTFTKPDQALCLPPPV